LIGRLGLLAGDLFTEPTGHHLARLVGALFNRGEVELGGVGAGSKEIAREQCEKLLEPRVLGIVGSGSAEHHGPP
jgi:hypothetical protein